MVFCVMILGIPKWETKCILYDFKKYIKNFMSVYIYKYICVYIIMFRKA